MGYREVFSLDNNKIRRHKRHFLGITTLSFWCWQTIWCGSRAGYAPTRHRKKNNLPSSQSATHLENAVAVPHLSRLGLIVKELTRFLFFNRSYSSSMLIYSVNYRLRLIAPCFLASISICRWFWSTPFTWEMATLAFAKTCWTRLTRWASR